LVSTVAIAVADAVGDKSSWTKEVFQIDREKWSFWCQCFPRTATQNLSPARTSRASWR